MKRIHIKKGLGNTNKGLRHTLEVRGMMNFICEFEGELWKTLLKKGWTYKKCSNIILDKVPLSHHITSDKKNDVKKLLNLIFGQEWEGNESLKWYSNILNNTPDAPDDNEENENEENCNCLDDDVGVHI